MDIFLSNYNKSIRLYPNGFSLLKRTNGNTFSEKDYSATPISFLPEKATSFFEEYQPTEEILVISNLSIPLLIPKALYDESAAFDYLKMQFDITTPGVIKTDELEDYILLHHLNSEVFNAVKKLTPTFSCTHQATILHRYISEQPEFAKTGNFLSVFVENDSIDILLEKNSKIQLANRFGYSTEYDIFYHCINILKQYHIEPTDIHLVCFNQNNKQLQDLFKQYFSQLSFIR